MLRLSPTTKHLQLNCSSNTQLFKYTRLIKIALMFNTAPLFNLFLLVTSLLYRIACVLLIIQVEQEFYIPKLSQNWIIGSRLVRGTEQNKPIKEFGIKGEGIQEVSVFMYVMHTKKAQVPNEVTRLRQQQHFRQQQQGLQNISQQAQVSKDSELCNQEGY